MASIDFPLTVKALEVEQPLGICYVAVIPARILLDVCYSQAARAELSADGYILEGNQRFIHDKRLTQIAEYIARSDTAFPNALILAVDPLDDAEGPDGVQTADGAAGWQVERGADGSLSIRIPTNGRMAAVVDGQHRLFAFAKDAAAPNRDMPLICSIYFDLPKPFQAQLFATINSTQKRVDKSLTYELFGYNVAEEPPESWTPEKLAVYLTRRLNVQSGSPLSGRVLVAPKRGPELESLTREAGWHVSTAVVVEGLMRLYSSNPKRDSNVMMQSFTQKRRVLSRSSKDKSPLRQFYLATNDWAIYETALRFLQACDDVFWKDAPPRSFITRTVGIQALFDVLHRAAAMNEWLEPPEASTFRAMLAPAGDIDFSIDRFRNASGSGRVAIRNAILDTLGPVSSR